MQLIEISLHFRKFPYNCLSIAINRMRLLNWIMDLRELRFVAEILEELQMWRGAFVASAKKLGKIRGLGRNFQCGTTAPEMLNNWLSQLRICACKWVYICLSYRRVYVNIGWVVMKIWMWSSQKVSVSWLNWPTVVVGSRLCWGVVSGRTRRQYAVWETTGSIVWESWSIPRCSLSVSQHGIHSA